MQQFPPFFSFNFDQVEMVGGSVVSFFLVRGLIQCPAPIPRATATMASWLIMDPGGADVVIRLIEAERRIQPPAEWIQFWIGRLVLSHP